MAMSLATDSKLRKFSTVWIQSLAIHALIFFFFIGLTFQSENKESIKIARGGSVTLFLNADAQSYGIGKKADEQISNAETIGASTAESEIKNFQNSISYPILALEQQLEDDCSYKVAIDQSGYVESLVAIIPCKFNVFDHQIKNQLRTWKFKSSMGKSIVLPIRFRIHDSE